MSQAKVDRYKKEKKNRAKMMKRQKAKKVVGVLICSMLVGAAIGYPLGKYIYKDYAKTKKANATISAEALDYNVQKYWSTHYSDYVSFPNATATDADSNVSTDSDASGSDATATDAQ